MKVVSTEALTRFLTVIKGDLAKKEPSITKKSAFNLDKTDTVQNNRDLLFTSKGAFDLKTEITNSIDAKMNISGGTFTGSISMSGSNTVNITHNYGIKSYLSNGSLDYVLYVNTSDQLVLGFNGRPITTQGTITSPTFIGALQGKADNSKAADSAAKLNTPRGITVGEKTLNFDGTGNINFKLNEICATSTFVIPMGDSYRKKVIGLIKLSAASTSTAETFSGVITAQRGNGITSPINCMITLADCYSYDYKPNVTIFGTTLNGIRACKFQYNGIWYGGVEIFISDATHNFIDVIGNIRNSVGKPYFEIDYYDTRTGALNTEINNSLSFDVYFQTNLAINNNSPVYSESYKPTPSAIGAFPSSGGTINGNTNITGNLAVSGNINGSKTYNAVWNDYAEFFPKLKGYKTEPGDIIALSSTEEGEVYELATDSHKLIVGVHSDQYGHLIGGENPENGEDYVEYNKDKYIPVGLAGRVPVKFSGVAEKGMKVVPSDIPGVGREFMFGDNYENVIGYIVENNYEDGIRRVKIKIGK